MKICENCGERVEVLHREPRWRRLEVCGLCLRHINTNVANASDETLAQWDANERELKDAGPLPLLGGDAKETERQ